MYTFDPRVMYFYAMMQEADMRLRQARRAGYDPPRSPARSPRDLLVGRLHASQAWLAAAIFGALFLVAAVALSVAVCFSDPSLVPMLVGVAALFFCCIAACAAASERARGIQREIDSFDACERARRAKIVQDAEQRRRSWAEDEARRRDKRAEDEARREYAARAHRAEDERRVDSLRRRYERGETIACEAPIVVHPAETCLHACPCSGIDVRRSEVARWTGWLVITTKRVVVVERSRAHVAFLGEIVRFNVVGDYTIRLWLTNRSSNYDIAVDYPREAAACLLIAFKQRGITPPRPVEV